ncbi:Myb-like DNA-binding domain containing protein [Tritrichomonas foetus]|uniref:Myb-like DNA-binding domain containing protein n=1 Tax=Tritrichomonas foetus TaxID=1144522 RepID=A0A1J4JSZ4_9EUKA|nr:Myb-like DNA-binding domain containing protein [Tritrichomonas foetus]|eukprot:OHT01552.1 Myb-like DNA-binding domain containing protein [Tritrichomonas foetus]
MEDDAINKRRRRTWTKEEDAKLKRLVEEKKEKSWVIISEHFRNRSNKDCRDRYFLHLSPSVEKRKWTPEEELLLIEKYDEFGPKWVKLTAFFNKRSPNDLKNRVKLIQKRKKPLKTHLSSLSSSTISNCQNLLNNSNLQISQSIQSKNDSKLVHKLSACSRNIIRNSIINNEDNSGQIPTLSNNVIENKMEINVSILKHLTHQPEESNSILEQSESTSSEFTSESEYIYSNSNYSSPHYICENHSDTNDFNDSLEQKVICSVNFSPQPLSMMTDDLISLFPLVDELQVWKNENLFGDAVKAIDSFIIDFEKL